ncbi:hypothetical protein J32TS6_34170 [Virgibacillus pantothenticus]|uniref:Uncharacterized protein n=1 Tax=Virgibacillus pantothenticus TaxID=1473 RepID=A0A0L0QVD6_VIRPA|nr:MULTISPECIES: hypothetical protein [Virgibacillus]API91289.1 hypothetical protein BKP57_05195 [Virgibacillus sp. 6R]KNE22524.1 hypothetical protein AFK71_02600 [Virgibacillus pantothenticus]MBS7426520.1 hypothetical protein [Virgibacillus sp. 19R1-5]MBU8567295.1 hypothetical protein [Virgibacillus pantothenticus]MBU8600050.1 hypothetical protein [Virgibacillus pantothenticus]
MICCLKIYHPTITTLTKCKILRFIFKDYPLEIEVISKNAVIIYVWGVPKKEVWQAVTNFESTNVIAGYGFSQEKSEARLLAEAMVIKWLTVINDKSKHPQAF